MEKDGAGHEKIYTANLISWLYKAGTWQGMEGIHEKHLTCSRARASSLSTLDLSRWRALRSRWKSQLVPAMPAPLITMFSNTGFRSGASLPPEAKVHRSA